MLDPSLVRQASKSTAWQIQGSIRTQALNTMDEAGNTWVHVPATYGHATIVKLILEQNHFHIDQQRLDGLTPLMRY